MKAPKDYNFILTLATVVVMTLLSILCVASMFYYKWAHIDAVSVYEKLLYQNTMNLLASPFLVALLILLGLCIPNRLISTRWLNWFAISAVLVCGILWIFADWTLALVSILSMALLLQILTLVLNLMGYRLNFAIEGYWARTGSCLLHLGLVVFCLVLMLLKPVGFIPSLFWISSGLIFLGLILVLYC